MADLDTRYLLTWKFKLPPGENKSSNFRMFGGVYCLKIRPCAGGHFYKIVFHHVNGNLHDKNCAFAIFVESVTGSSELEPVRKDLQLTTSSQANSVADSSEYEPVEEDLRLTCPPQPNSMAVLSAVTAAKCVTIGKALELLTFTEAQISAYAPGFQRSRELKIVVFFHDMQNSAAHSRSETIFLSTEDDFANPVGSGRCSRNLQEDKQSSDKSARISKELSLDLESLSADFCRLLDKKPVADVRLKCGDRVTYAHRVVLAARSEVFAAEFQNKMPDIVTSTVDLIGLDDVTVRDAFLKYLYTGKLPSLLDDVLRNLYVAAVNYLVQTLKEACCERMIGGLDEENCLGFLSLAYEHGDHRLRDEAIKFIVQHMEVLRSQAWTGFEEDHPRLANDVYKMFVFQKHFS